jgi:hypothetical protein
MIENVLDVHTIGWCVGVGGFLGVGLWGVGGSIQVCGVITGKGQTGVTVTPGGGPGFGLPGVSGGTGPMFSSGQDVEDLERDYNAASLGLGIVDVGAQWGNGHCGQPVSSNYVGWGLGPPSAWEGKSQTFIWLQSSIARKC